MKILFVKSLTIFTAITIASGISSCVSSNLISEKTGVQLWGENCNRCHNPPSPADFNDKQWAKIGMHMKVRANLTEEEIKKITEFLQSSN